MNSVQLPVTDAKGKPASIHRSSFSIWLNKSIFTHWTASQLILLAAVYVSALSMTWYKFNHNNSAAEMIITDTTAVAAELAQLEKDVDKLEGKLNAFMPRTPYIVVNTSQNNFRLYKNNQLLREGKCSTGSYIMLQNGDKQTWIFRTPKGEFRIQGKNRSPVWKKPDWAFVEEGLPIPSANHPSRYVYGVLGDYSLSLGSGYLIHGTLYKRFLGLPVTHGCIRMNDEDLEATFKTLSIGSKVYIF